MKLASKAKGRSLMRGNFRNTIQNRRHTVTSSNSGIFFFFFNLLKYSCCAIFYELQLYNSQFLKVIFNFSYYYKILAIFLKLYHTCL